MCPRPLLASEPPASFKFRAPSSELPDYGTISHLALVFGHALWAFRHVDPKEMIAKGIFRSQRLMYCPSLVAPLRRSIVPDTALRKCVCALSNVCCFCWLLQKCDETARASFQLVS